MSVEPAGADAWQIALAGDEPTIRVVVERADGVKCALAVGDSFEVIGSLLAIPSGRPFCTFAMAAALPIVGLRQSPRPHDDWLVRKPFVCCPDASETVVMRIDMIDASVRSSRRTPEPT